MFYKVQIEEKNMTLINLNWVLLKFESNTVFRELPVRRKLFHRDTENTIKKVNIGKEIFQEEGGDKSQRLSLYIQRLIRLEMIVIKFYCKNHRAFKSTCVIFIMALASCTANINGKRRITMCRSVFTLILTLALIHKRQ